MAIASTLMKNLLITLAERVLVASGLTAAESVKYAVIEKQIFGSGTLLVFSNEELDDITKIVSQMCWVVNDRYL